MRRLHKLAARQEQSIIDIVGADAHARLFGELRAIASLNKRLPSKA